MSPQKIKISDLVIAELVNRGIDTVFGVTGGAVVHFFDSIESNDRIKAIFFNHEQGASFAVGSYAKARKSIGAGIFTTGPGGTNALTGLAAAWLDSVPCLFLSGQARTNQTIHGRKLRQVGTQELDIVSVVKPITKYAVTVYDLHEAKYHIQKALYLATHGRPGPVWVDMPVDIAWSFVDPEELVEFNPALEFGPPNLSQAKIESDVARLAELIRSSERPVFLVGSGVRSANCEELLKSVLEKYQFPFVSTWSICDWITSDHPLNIGRPGLSGQRGANLALQNSDLVVSIGSHLNSTIIGTKPELFARDARIVLIDIDENELEHCPLGIEVAIQADAKEVVQKLSTELGDWRPKDAGSWLDVCARYKVHNRIGLDYQGNQDQVNSYFFKHILSEISRPGDLFVVDGGGTIVYSSFQSIEIKEAQRLILSTGLCSMGSGIPEAIGVHLAFPERRIFCFVGDGSFPFNVQELQVIRDLGMPIKLFVFNNAGYVSIRTTQKDFLGGRYVGSSPDSGLHLPDVQRLSAAFEIPFFRIDSQRDLQCQLETILATDGPVVCEVMVSAQQEIVPRQGFAPKGDGTFEPRPIEDMYPFLDRQILSSLMVVPALEAQDPKLAGREIDLLKNYPRVERPVGERAKDKRDRTKYVRLDEHGDESTDEAAEQLILEEARQFGESYFDGDRHHGYGGYRYDKKFWGGVAKDIVATYGLKPGDRVLEVGCAKGFLLQDLAEEVPGLIVKGVDISEYAIEHALPSVRGHVSVADAKALPFPSNSFKLVLAFNTLSELPIQDCRAALAEIGRVSQGKAFVTLNAWRNRREKERLFRWNLTALSNYTVSEWKRIMSDVGYTGDYYWFFVS